MVLKENKHALYYYLILGTIGTVIVPLVTISYILKETDSTGYMNISPLLGFLLTITYINYLEKRAGISKKLTTVRSIVSMILFLAITYYLFIKPLF